MPPLWTHEPENPTALQHKEKVPVVWKERDPWPQPSLRTKAGDRRRKLQRRRLSLQRLGCNVQVRGEPALGCRSARSPGSSRPGTDGGGRTNGRVLNTRTTVFCHRRLSQLWRKPQCRDVSYQEQGDSLCDRRMLS